jgi:hypothetical protein
VTNETEISTLNFEAYLVKDNTNTGLIICYWAIAFLMISGVCTNIDAVEDAAWGGIVMAMLLFIVGLFSGAAKSGIYRIDTEIFHMDEEKIVIGIVVYPLQEISNLEFRYHAFNGQSPYGYYTETAGEAKYGISNRVSFTYRKMNVNARFYLADEQHANWFFQYVRQRQSEGLNCKILDWYDRVI